MKKLHYFICAALILSAFAGCKKDEPIVYTTLAELATKSTTTYADFDIHIKGLTVSGVFKSYAQLEDATAGVQLNNSAHTFKPGQLIDGHITGKARISSGALLFSELEVSGATVTQTQNVPCTTIKLSDLIADKVKYSHRRVKLENMTFVNGFNGTAGGSGIISQRGVQMSATCRPIGFKVEDGAQGDLICYPTSAACYVFDAKDFNEHEIQSPLTSKTAYGVYSATDDAASEIFVYEAGKDQYSYSSDGKNLTFRLQNYNEEWLAGFQYPAKVKAGQVVGLSLDASGVSAYSPADISVTIEKVGQDKLWLMDYPNNMGYVVYYEKEEK